MTDYVKPSFLIDPSAAARLGSRSEDPNDMSIVPNNTIW